MSEKKELLFKIEHLQKYFPIKKKSVFQRKQEYVRANKDISIEIFKNETLGLVGESGCGKSTFGRTLIQLYEATGGSALYYGIPIESFMPGYVKTAYRAIPKKFKNYQDDKNQLDKLIEETKNSTDKSRDEINDIISTEREKFNSVYKNMLRLAGGLLSHDNLDEVKDVLLNQYNKRSEMAQLHKKREDLELHDEVILDKNKSLKIRDEIKELDQKIESLTPGVQEVDNKVEELRNKCSTNDYFEEYEEQRDDGMDLTSLTAKEMQRLRRELQIIFQDPYSSLDPRFTVGRIIGEGLIAHGIFDKPNTDEYNDYIIEVMEKCGLDAKHIHRYPHQFSGGQRQRIGIARALALNPEFVVCDEAVSALDVSIQAQVLRLLQDLKDENDLTYLFITHDLGVVKYISDRIGVMYFGNLVEIAPAEQIFTNPQHPYTKALLKAIPRTDESKEVQFELDEYYREQRGDVNYDEIFDFGFDETGEVDMDWYEVSPEHFVACRLKDNN